ncbi:MAG: SDR family NAD(P)-dependent oxidoreductase [Gammaproteobacteria bacterium]|nr:SDR family NAD(P)-dependent oxidoreductase [Gammaproteobacteria bacterium]
MNTDKNILMIGIGNNGRIGHSICDYYLKAGYRVFATTRQKPISSQDELALPQEKFSLFHSDLSNVADIMRIVDQACAEIIIFNLSNFTPFSSENKTLADRSAHLVDCFQAHIQIPLLVSSYVAESYLKRQKPGLLIFLGDAFLHKGGVYPYEYIHYGATKCAASEITKSINAKFATSGIRSITLLLGPILPATQTSAKTKSKLSHDLKVVDKRDEEWIGVESVLNTIDFVIQNKYISEYLYIDGNRNWQTLKEY